MTPRNEKAVSSCGASTKSVEVGFLLLPQLKTFLIDRWGNCDSFEDAPRAGRPGKLSERFAFLSVKLYLNVIFRYKRHLRLLAEANPKWSSRRLAEEVYIHLKQALENRPPGAVVQVPFFEVYWFCINLFFSCLRNLRLERFNVCLGPWAWAAFGRQKNPYLPSAIEGEDCYLPASSSSSTLTGLFSLMRKYSGLGLAQKCVCGGAKEQISSFLSIQ